MDNTFLLIALAFLTKDETFFSSELFDESITKNLNAISWWKTAQNDNPQKISPQFLELCSDLLKMPSSTAGLERSFSVFNDTTDKRNRLGLEKAKKIAFIKQFL